MIKRLSITELQRIFYKEKERLEQLPRDGSNMYTRGTATYLLEVCDELTKEIKRLRYHTTDIATIPILLRILRVQLECEEILETSIPVSDVIEDTCMDAANALFKY